MQTNRLLVVSGIHKLPPRTNAALRGIVATRGHKMSKTVSLGYAPSVTLFGRLMATVDRLLMASAEIAIRNGDIPYFGL